MKLFAIWLIVAVAGINADLNRQASLDAVNKLQKILPQISQLQNLTLLELTEAKLKVSTSLRNFYYSVQHIKSESFKEVLVLEEQVLRYGETVTEKWCWENNVPLLAGVMGWLGNGYSECASKLNGELKDIVAKASGRLRDDEDVVSMFRLLEVFEKKNIISNRVAISEAIDELQVTKENLHLKFAEIDSEFRDDLDAQLLIYDSCLKDAFTRLGSSITEMKKHTEQCLKNL